MKQKERFDEKPKQEHTEPKHHKKPSSRALLYMNHFGQKAANCGIVCCRAWESTEQEQFLKF